MDTIPTPGPQSGMFPPKINLEAAKSAFILLREQVKAIEATCADGEGVLVMCATSGTAPRLDNVVLKGECLIFIGVDDQDKVVRLIQHYTQLSVMLVKDEAKKPERRPIGFNPEF